MTRAVALLGVLPTVRRGFLTTLMLSGVFDMVASIVLLSYQLALTEGFQRIVPSIIVTSFFCAAFPFWFLYSRPYSIRLPGGADAKVGGTRDKVAKFSRSIAAELICLAGTGVWVLIAVSNLHAETPGLISHCGGFPICRMLLAVLALTWICFLFLCLSFASLLVATLYFTVRRASPLPIFMTSFFAVDWERYSGRPVNRAHTVRRPKKGRENASKFPGQGRVLEGEIGDDRFKRDGSEAPVFPNSSNMTDSMYATDSILNASVLNSTGALDWDVQSDFSACTRPSTMVGVSSGLASEPATPRDAVFVLMDDAATEVAEKAEVGEKKAVEGEKREGGGGGVGSAL